jgi:outer membrane protein OmpA-like peptidoglycan-associated protein
VLQTALEFLFEKQKRYMKNNLFTLAFALLAGVSLAQVVEEKTIGDTLKVSIRNVGPEINSSAHDYSVNISADGKIMFYTSRRAVEKTKNKVKKGLDNIYFSSFDEKQKKWKEATISPEPLNSEGNNNSNIALSNDASWMLLYRDDHDLQTGDIYESFQKGMSWTDPVKLPEPINTKHHESSASISPDGRTIYFVSDRPDGSKGGRDIWYCTKDENGKWGKAMNIGAPINTKDDEDCVFIHPDGKTLYFSSTRKGGSGGYDIYMTKNEKGLWSNPENIGSPINTPDDDLFFVLTASGKTAFYSSERKGTLGGRDIFEISFTALEKKKDKGPRLALLKGKIYDAKTKQPIEATIELTNVKTGEKTSNFKSNSQSGSYMMSLPAGVNYGIYVTANGYLFHSENIDLPDASDYQEIEKDIYLYKIEKGAKIVLNNIFYDYGKATLRSESFAELNRVAQVLKDNPDIKIELGGHTDTRGSAEFNQKLSEDRAKSCVDYLVKQGIPVSRLKYKGYGESTPINSDAVINAEPLETRKEELHQQNRRTEFKVLE